MEKINALQECIHIPIYGCSLYLFIGKTVEDITPLVDSVYPNTVIDLKDKVGYTVQLTHTNGVTNFAMFLPLLNRPVADIVSTINHESIHAAWYILDYVGVIVNADNHEALTYLTQYIFDNVYSQCIGHANLIDALR